MSSFFVHKNNPLDGSPMSQSVVRSLIQFVFHLLDSLSSKRSWMKVDACVLDSFVLWFTPNISLIFLLLCLD